MPVQRRVFAGGSRLWLLLAFALLALAAEVSFFLEQHLWPLGLLLFGLACAIGFMRVRRWQCRRCRAQYRRCPGHDRRSADDQDDARPVGRAALLPPVSRPARDHDTAERQAVPPSAAQPGSAL